MPVSSEEYSEVLDMCTSRETADRTMLSGLLVDGVVEELKTTSMQVDERYQQRWLNNREIIEREERQVKTAHLMRQIDHIFMFEKAETKVDEVLLMHEIPF